MLVGLLFYCGHIGLCRVLCVNPGIHIPKCLFKLGPLAAVLAWCGAGPICVAPRTASAGLLAAMMVTQTHVPATQVGPYGGGRILGPLAGTSTSPAKRAKVPQQAANEGPSPVLFATALASWLQPESSQHKGLILKRKPWWKDIQEVVDRAVSRGDVSEEDEIKVQLCKSGEGPRDLGQVAEMLLRKVRMVLPEDLQQAIRQDVIEVGEAVARLCPWNDKFDFKIEVIGESNCSRWHRDNYCARAIVTYNATGTLYTPDENVNFWELENCGVNEHILKDPTCVKSVGVGDVFFIKGTKFPCGSKGLVHKSPEVLRHYNGMVVNLGSDRSPF